MEFEVVKTVSLIIGIIFGLIVLFAFIIPTLLNVNLLALTPGGFAAVIGGLICFGLAAIFGSWGKYKEAKTFTSLGSAIVFIGFLIVEVFIFKALVPQVQKIEFEYCERVDLRDLPSAISCILTGYAPPSLESWGFYSFILFYLVFPFAFMSVK